MAPSDTPRDPNSPGGSEASHSSGADHPEAADGGGGASDGESGDRSGARAPDEHDNGESGHSRAKTERQSGEAAHPESQLSFPVVGIGASAGGLSAMQAFLKHLPSDPGMAFVMVQHLDPDHKSEVPRLLQRVTEMTVAEAEEGMSVEPNCVFIIPPGKNISIDGGKLHLSELGPREQRAPIDFFFRSLAESQGAKAVGIVLSGTGSGGTLGLERIKEVAGLTMAQDPDEAEYAGMPQSTIREDMADLVLPVEQLAERLIQQRDGLVQIDLPSQKDALDPEDEEALHKIFAHLKAHTDRDFSYYKRSTMLRRIGRRMQVTQTNNLQGYLNYLQEHTAEVQELLRDLLITVTNFFRDEEPFDALQEKVLPRLFEDRDPDDPVRVWVAGCATGEEAYSVAMLLQEEAAQHKNSYDDIQVFATDLSPDAIASAREGFYPASIEGDVSEKRLRRFFEREGTGYRIRQSLRDTVVFADHDLMSDPPFSRLDLITCRNLLIYLKREAQTRIFETFHYALRPSGYLFLGSAESIEERQELFTRVDKGHRIYQRKEGRTSVPQLTGPMSVPGGRPRDSGKAAAPPKEAEHSQQQEFEEMRRQLLEDYMPPSIIVSAHHEVLHIFEGGGKYLRFGTGEPTQNVTQLIRPELRSVLRTALFRALRRGERTSTRPATVPVGGEEQRVRLVVRPLPEGNEARFAQVLFERLTPEEDETGEQPRSEQAHDGSPAGTGHSEAEAAEGQHDAGEVQHDDVVEQLEEELRETQYQLRSTIEEYESSMEELKASNEELQSMNEELRSTSEELETSKEELQSMNEELTTVNQELQDKNEALSRANSDLRNLLTSTEIATLFLDRELKIRRFTPRARELFNIIDADIGRPLSHVTKRFDYEGLVEDAREVLKNLTPIEQEAQSEEGRWFLVRFRPYRTVEDKIDGVVITFVDITERREAEEELRKSEERYRLLVEGVDEYAIIMLDPEGRIATWNVGAEGVFGYAAEEALGQPGTILFTEEAQARGMLKGKMGTAADEGRAASDHWYVRKDGSRFWGSGVMTALYDEDDDLRGFAKVIRDNTERKEAEEKLRRFNETLEERVEKRAEQVRKLASRLTMAEQRERHRISLILHDDLQQRLYAIQMKMTFLKRHAEDVEWKEILGTVEDAEEQIQNAIDTTRQLSVNLSPPVLKEEGLADALGWLATQMGKMHNLDVELEAEHAFYLPNEDQRVLLFQVVRELLFNVAKHAEVNHATVTLTDENDHMVIRAIDEGRGFDPEQVNEQEDGNKGFGLSTARERVELFGGRLDIESTPGEGTRVTVRAPLEFYPAGEQPSNGEPSEENDGPPEE